MPQKKQVIVIRYEGKPIYIAQVVELEYKEVFELQKECDQNALQVIGELSHTINRLSEKIDKLENKVKYLLGED